ncbi:MAG: S24 family peptidase [Planctomycetes bacterium]|nr:S24 family peptidase [Planctomycetota bacterium]
MIENGKVDNPPSDSALRALERALDLGDGELRRAAAWENTPGEVRERIGQLEEQARQGRELAEWLKKSSAKRGDGARGLDQLIKSGELAKRINETLRRPRGGKSAAAKAPDTTIDPTIPLRYRVPLINKVAAGYPRDFTDLDHPVKIADEYVSCPGVNDPTAFAARVVGDSMLPDYREGDIVVFSPRAKTADGDDCFVRLEPDHECTFKRIFFETAGRKQMIRLQPLNPQFPPRTVERQHVAGLYKAVMVMHRL